MLAKSIYLVTGAMGCLGAWTLYHLVKRGANVVSFDLSANRQRLNLLLSAAEQAAITFINGDLTDSAQVAQVVESQAITHIIHLAALQVPFCRANPVLGAKVNVVGTLNIFEAARTANLPHVVYASSIAVYGPPEQYPPGLIQHDAPLLPMTLYGGYKQCNEQNARVYAQDFGVNSTALRPYTVYGVGRDQGLTSDPTKAMLAAAAGQPYHIGFGGTGQFQWASDVAQQFILAADKPLMGAHVYNLGGRLTHMEEVVAAIERAAPGVKLTFEPRPLAFPLGFDDSRLRQDLGTVPETPLMEGIAHTIQHFQAKFASGELIYSA